MVNRKTTKINNGITFVFQTLCRSVLRTDDKEELLSAVRIRKIYLQRQRSDQYPQLKDTILPRMIIVSLILCETMFEVLEKIEQDLEKE